MRFWPPRWPSAAARGSLRCSGWCSSCIRLLSFACLLQYIPSAWHGQAHTKLLSSGAAARRVGRRMVCQALGMGVSMNSGLRGPVVVIGSCALLTRGVIWQHLHVSTTISHDTVSPPAVTEIRHRGLDGQASLAPIPTSRLRARTSPSRRQLRVQSDWTDSQ
jgi:hypothetical protein